MEAKKSARLVTVGPALVVLLFSSLIVLVALWKANGDPLALVRIGTRFSVGDPDGSLGYDGQFNYYIASNINPEIVAAHLDVPAYRYQRILMPLLARFLVFGKQPLLPWSFLMIGLFSMAVGAWAVGELLECFGITRWYALVYGFWAGFILSLVTDLSEPLAFALVACALLANEKNAKPLFWCLLGFSLFAKEVTAVFVGAILLSMLVQRKWSEAIAITAIALAPFILFQVWLWFVFGEPGIGSGGALATSFEIIPYMGLFRIGQYSPFYLLAMLLVFGPGLVLPSLWGIFQSVRHWILGDKNIYVAILFFNAFVIAFTPFSTFRETGGILRFASGLVLAILLFAGYYKMKRVLNYSVFWIVLNAFLLK